MKGNSSNKTKITPITSYKQMSLASIISYESISVTPSALIPPCPLFDDVVSTSATLSELSQVSSTFISIVPATSGLPNTAGSLPTGSKTSVPQSDSQSASCAQSSQNPSINRQFKITIIPREELKILISMAHRDERRPSEVLAADVLANFATRSNMPANAAKTAELNPEEGFQRNPFKKNTLILPNDSEKPVFDISKVNQKCEKRKNIIVFHEDNNAEPKRQKTTSWQNKIAQERNDVPSFSRGV